MWHMAKKSVALDTFWFQRWDEMMEQEREGCVCVCVCVCERERERERETERNPERKSEM